MLRIVFSDARPRDSGRAIFVDRDGVINCRRPGDYVLDWSQFIFVPGIREALRDLSSLQMPMIIISNQAAVGKRLLSPQGLEEITSQLRQTLAADGAILAAAYYCTHRVEDHCECRKPKPALLQRAAEDFNVELSKSVFIGDSQSDVQAARAAGCIPVLFGPGLGAGTDLLEWRTGLSVALKAPDLFQIVSKRLLGESPALRRD